MRNKQSIKNLAYRIQQYQQCESDNQMMSTHTLVEKERNLTVSAFGMK